MMQSFINFQGQVLHLAQGDARPFNYVGNSIAYIAVGPETRSNEELPPRADPGTATLMPASAFFL